MADESMLDSGSTDGYSVQLTAEVDEASIQGANRSVGSLEKGLKSLAGINLSSLGSSLKSLSAGLAGALTFTVTNNFDEVQNLLRAAKAGLDNDAFKRWTSIEVQLGLSKGSITKDLADIYEQMAKIKTVGDLNKDQFLALGLIGENAEEFINEKDMTKRVTTVLDLALKSDRPPNEMASLLRTGLGDSFADLYYYLSLTGKSFEELFGKMSVFTNKDTQSASVAFSSEWGAATSSVTEMGRKIAATFGEYLTPFLAQFNTWVKDYQAILEDILSFNQGWFSKAARLLAGIPQYDIFTDKTITWETQPNPKVDNIPLRVTSAGVAQSISDYSKAVTELKARQDPKHPKAGRPLYMGDVYENLPRTVASQPFLGETTLAKQGPKVEQELAELNKLKVATFYNEQFQKIMFTSTLDVPKMGYSPTADFSGINKKSFNYAERQNLGFDQETAHAIEKYLSTATVTQTNELMKMLTDIASRAVPISQIPELQGMYAPDQKIFLHDDIESIYKFIQKVIPRADTSLAPDAPVQVGQLETEVQKVVTYNQVNSPEKVTVLKQVDEKTLNTNSFEEKITENSLYSRSDNNSATFEKTLAEVRRTDEKITQANTRQELLTENKSYDEKVTEATIIKEEIKRLSSELVIDNIIERGTSSVVSSQIQQANTMTLSFPGVATREQGAEVGKGLIEGLGKTLGDAFRLNDLAVGDLG